MERLFPIWGIIQIFLKCKELEGDRGHSTLRVEQHRGASSECGEEKKITRKSEHLERKSRQKEERRREKEVGLIEERIMVFEEEISNLEKIMAAPDFYGEFGRLRGNHQEI